MKKRKLGIALVGATLIGVIGPRLSAPAGAQPALQDRESVAAATVAVLAVADAELLDPAATFLDYQGILRKDGGWVADFDVYQCVANALIQTCKLDREPARLVLKLVQDEIVVTGAKGPPFDERRRHEVVGYRKPVELRRSSWFVPAAVVNPNRRIVGSPLWGGAMDSPALGSTCFASLANAGGDRIWRSQTIEIAAADEEDSRSGAILAFPQLPDGLSGLPSIECDRWVGEGWKPAGEATVDYHDGLTAVVKVPLVWRDRAFARASTRCDAELLNDSGAPIARGSGYLAGPRTGIDGETPPFRRIFAIPVPSHVDAARFKAVVACTLVTSDEFEGRS